MAERVEVAMGFGRSEALIPKADGKAELPAQGVCEGLGAGGLRTLVAGHVERVADDGFPDRGVFAQDAGDGFEVVAKAVASGGSMQGEERLRGVAEFIREREPDAAVAYIEAQHAFDPFGVHPPSLEQFA